MTGLIEDDGGSSEDEVEKLESDVKQMAQKLLEYRTTLPDQLRSILTSVLTAQRPVFPDPSEPPNPDETRDEMMECRRFEGEDKWEDSGKKRESRDKELDPVSSQHSAPNKEQFSVSLALKYAGGQAKDSEGRLCAEEDQETAEKLRLLKDKISSNVSAMPIVLKRMKECISRIDKLDSNNGIIHPAFKRKKTS
uniref:Uncharacterized protein n=1 Tax=Fagus sylvatica TaxID=28930 RepID=A0A2N9I176_FAGSY